MSLSKPISNMGMPDMEIKERIVKMRYGMEIGYGQELVRCRDCKHRDPEDGKCDSGHGIQWQLSRPDDWFCADGERKEGR